MTFVFPLDHPHPGPPEAITAAIDDLTRDRSAMSLAAANRDIYQLLKEGVSEAEVARRVGVHRQSVNR